jgi:hypothetical protein
MTWYNLTNIMFIRAFVSKYVRRFIVGGVLLIFAAISCNLPAATPTLDAGATLVAATLSALQIGVFASQTALAAQVTSTPPSTNTLQPQISPTPSNPHVIRDALCWVGPGNAYEVVSSVRTGTQVQLLGRGSLAGWYIINNPIYHDPCWIEAANLQIDPGYDLSGLPIINPPPSPTPTLTDTPTATNTPTPTNTP